MPSTIFQALLPVCLFLAQEQPAFRSDVQLVTIPCTVVDAAGKLVHGLTREDFRVFDNGMRRIIDRVSFDEDQPLTLGVIIDTSDSQQERLTEHRETARAVMQQLLRPGDRSFVVSMSEDIRMWPNLQAAPGELLGEPCPKRQNLSTCGGSPLWNALYETARMKLRATAGNKALLVLTDGYDTGSTHTWRQTADEIGRSQAAMYAIQYRGSAGARAPVDLYRLLEESGGVWFGEPMGDVSRVVERIESDLRHRYVLTIHPDSTRPGRHELRVEVNRPGLRVRARTAYLR